ncbi:ABC transporter permease [Alteromonas gracilis]
MSTRTDAPAQAPTPVSAWTMIVRQTDYWWLLYRRTFRGGVVSNFVMPLVTVLAMGVLGGYVSVPPERLEGATSYLDFVVPGLLVGTAMMTAFGEMTYPVMGMVKWNRTYYGMAATPLRVVDLVHGHLVFFVLRQLVATAVFVVVLAPFGVWGGLGGAIGAFSAALLTGTAFAAVVYAFAAGADTEATFSLLFRIVAMPLFLFSGAYFPVGNLAAPLEWLARLLPLWHGVDLARMATLGTWQADLVLLHIGYLAAMIAGGVWVARRRLARRMEA